MKIPRAMVIALTAIWLGAQSIPSAFAQSFSSASSSTCDCQALSSPPSSNTSVPSGNALCAVSGLSVPVAVSRGSSLVKVCYALFGNALGRPHDGAVAWVDTPGGPVATDALPPQALGVFPASTTLAECQTVRMAGPLNFKAQVEVAFSTDNGLAHQQWGCASPKNPMALSWLSLEIQPQR
ncbi:MAG: hypothetical protein ACREQ4_18580 [Candidatus Binataceae bacterium]